MSKFLKINEIRNCYLNLDDQLLYQKDEESNYQPFPLDDGIIIGAIQDDKFLETVNIKCYRKDREEHYFPDPKPLHYLACIKNEEFMNDRFRLPYPFSTYYICDKGNIYHRDDFLTPRNITEDKHVMLHNQKNQNIMVSLLELHLIGIIYAGMIENSMNFNMVRTDGRTILKRDKTKYPDINFNDYFLRHSSVSEEFTAIVRDGEITNRIIGKNGFINPTFKNLLVKGN